MLRVYMEGSEKLQAPSDFIISHVLSVCQRFYAQTSEQVRLNITQLPHL